MAKKKVAKMKKVEIDSPEMELRLQAGYPGMTREFAQSIIDLWEKDPKQTKWPFDKVQEAKAFLAALTTKPSVIAQNPHWKPKYKGTS